MSTEQKPIFVLSEMFSTCDTLEESTAYAAELSRRCGDARVLTAAMIMYNTTAKLANARFEEVCAEYDAKILALSDELLLLKGQGLCN